MIIGIKYPPSHTDDAQVMNCHYDSYEGASQTHTTAKNMLRAPFGAGVIVRRYVSEVPSIPFAISSRLVADLVELAVHSATHNYQLH